MLPEEIREIQYREHQEELDKNTFRLFREGVAQLAELVILMREEQKRTEHVFNTGTLRK